jgi:hypothetical protein
MRVEKWYSLNREDWKVLEDQFKSSYLPVLRFITENKGSFAEARDVYIEAFYYYTRSVELKGKSYLEKSSGLIYSFSRIIWLKKLEKRKVDLSFVSHRREYYDLDHAFHEIDLMNERSEKAAEKIAMIGEPCRTLMIELIGKGKPFEEVGPRLGFSDKDRAISKVAGCVRKLVELLENKTFELDDVVFTKCLNFVLSDDKSDKPSGAEVDICLAMTSRVVATVKNHISSKERTTILREFRDRLLSDDAENLRKMESNPKRIKMRPLQLISMVVLIAAVVSGLTSFGIYAMNNQKEIVDVELPADSIFLDTIPEVLPPQWREKSAFLINSEGYALTDGSDLSKGDKIEVSNDFSVTGLAEVIGIDRKSGMALILVDSLLRSPVPFRLSNNSSAVGDELITLGYSGNKVLFGEATTQFSDSEKIRVGGETLFPGAPLFSTLGELQGVVLDSEEGPISQSVENIKAFLQMAFTEGMSLPTRNKLYYDNTSKRVEKIKPCILKIKYQV